MRIDPKGTVAGWPALLVRQTLRQLRTRLQWGLGELESAASVQAGEGRALIKALLAEGLIEAAGRNAWKVTQAGQTLSSATAAQRVTRATAQKALQQFLGRVEQVNNDPYFLGKVTRVVLFGSMLKPEVERLSDVDLAVEVASKEADFDRARVKNYERVEELAMQGTSFPELPRTGRLLVLGGLRILEGAEPRYRFSGLLRGEDVRADRPASIPLGPAGTDCGANGAGHAEARGAEAASARLPILREGP